MVHQQSASLVEFLSSASNELHSPVNVKFILHLKLETTNEDCCNHTPLQGCHQQKINVVMWKYLIFMDKVEDCVICCVNTEMYRGLILSDKYRISLPVGVILPIT
jgi:hypothetical protein